MTDWLSDRWERNPVLFPLAYSAVWFGVGSLAVLVKRLLERAFVPLCLCCALCLGCHVHLHYHPPGGAQTVLELPEPGETTDEPFILELPQ